MYRADGADGLMDYLGETWMPAVQRTVRLLWAAPIPLVAAFNGAATAGGLDFGLTCDVRVAATSARFAESYVNLGMVPVAGGMYLLPVADRAGAGLADDRHGEFISADTALQLGMVAEVCDASLLAQRATEIAREMTHGPAQTYARAKQVARARATEDLDTALQASLAANIELIALAEVRDRIVNVMERYSSSAHQREGRR